MGDRRAHLRAVHIAAVATDSAGNSARAEIGVWLSGTCSDVGDCPPASVRIITPVDGSRVCGRLTIEAAATDDIGIDHVEFQVDGRPLGVASESPYRHDWDTRAESDGWHVIRVVAHDTGGRQAFTSASVEVHNDGEVCDNRPNVRITSPVNDAYVWGSVGVRAEASDDEGVVGVKFFINNGLIADDTETPYGFEWRTDEFDEGVYTVKALATDLADQTSDAQVAVTVDRTPPEITLESPVAVLGENVVSFSATASDNFVVDRVEWYVDDGSVDFEVDDGTGEVIYLEGEPVLVQESRPHAGEFDGRALRSGWYAVLAVVYDRAGFATGALGSFELDRAPTVSFDTPDPGATVAGPTDVAVLVTDDSASVEVVFYVDGVETDSAHVPGPSVDSLVWLDWVPEFVRSARELRVMVTDSVGGTGEATRTVEVDHPLAVALWLCDPACAELVDGEEVSDTVTLLASTRDDDGEMTRAEFFVQDELLGASSTAPFALDWDTSTGPDGERRVRVLATSSNGSTAEAVGMLRVNNCDRDADTWVAESCGGPDCDDLTRR